ncbi:WXG100 family type VII secretion target [Actinomadura sp. HBU206391]|uniref:WXG100 family type VII secretion target n=1 Tax=Actinomadura sp. HBU206391 TaxID=2731692 RepID=UPI001650AA97|nr:WXG100 family type VII secretion target [Actinomadura sp. HBU206391]MBC6460514.1 WXG100 family type VII secretion target [Actinomadura sp. HBU206391]
MSELRVDPAGLRRSAQGFTDGSKRLGKIHDALDGALSAEGKCWGNDDTGKQFESEYLKQAEKVLKQFGDLSKSVAEIKTGLDEMAKVYQKAEDGSLRAVKGVGRR